MIDYQLLAHLCKDAYGRADFDIDGDIQGTIVQVGGYTVVTIRGTQFNFEDILRDLRAIPWWSKEIGHFCHSGFLKAARKVVPIVEEIEGPVVMNGHSKGGAISQDIAKIINRDLPVVTFGEPRSIIGRVDGLVNPDSRRFVNGMDCVPDHPWGYRHQAPMVRIGHKGNKFKDHRIADYIKNL